jgi:heptosyltransferase-2
MLIAAPERWDEACFAVPAVRALMAAGIQAGILCPEEQLPFWESLPGLALVPYPPDAKTKVLAPALAGRWAASIAWQRGVAAETFARARIPRRLGPAGKPLRKFLTHEVDGLRVSGPPPHRVRYYLDFVEALGPGTARAEFFSPASLGLQPERGTVLLSPGSDFGPNHEWPLERWAEIAAKLQDRGIRCTVACVPGSQDRCQALLRTLPDDTPFFEASPLGAVLPLLAVHQVVLAADGSLPHLAAYAGASCVTLFGPNSPQWKRPLGRRHQVVSRHTECAPCFLPKCPLDLRCQTELSTARVWTALAKALDLPD